MTYPLMPGMSSFPFPIDAVYTWVDGSDPVWRQRKNETLARMGFTQQNSTPLTIHETSLSECRFLDNDELRYSLRSLERFAPWIRTVHLITDSQIPQWLNLSQVHLVNHTELFPSKALPIFNSSAIETVFCNIPNLAEHFISFNDDFMLGHSVSPEDFFLTDGTPRVWFSRRSKSAPALFSENELEQMPPYSAGIARSRQIVAEHFGTLFSGRIQHTPKAMILSGFHDMWECFSEEMERTMRSPFRSSRDISIPMLNACFLLASGKGVPRIINGTQRFFDTLKGCLPHLGASLGDDNFPLKSRLIRWLHPLTFCLNDSEKASDADRKKMLQLHQHLFPHTSRFEKEPPRLR